MQARRAEADARRLFKEIEPLDLHADRRFQRDQQGAQPRQHQTLPGGPDGAGDNGPQDVPVKLGSRGHFRLMARNCDFVPLRVEFPRKGGADGHGVRRSDRR